MDIQTILDFDLIKVGSYQITVYKVLMIVVLFIVMKVFLRVLKKLLDRYGKFKNLDSGTKKALLQIISYIVWIIVIVVTLETIGVKVTILIAGSAALLVGIGLGLQQTFNDIISGVILLVEGSTKVGDILEIDSEVVKVKHIGLRASKVVSRDEIIIIIPNSLIVTNKVINWSNNNKLTRFRIKVGVAYGSDIDLVIRLLEESAEAHEMISKDKKPEGRFLDFGDSSLNFEVLFWSMETFRIEKASSDIRRAIDAKFRENGVTIPFPQRDLHFKSSNIGMIK